MTDLLTNTKVERDVDNTEKATITVEDKSGTELKTGGTHGGDPGESKQESGEGCITDGIITELETESKSVHVVNELDNTFFCHC